ncbi:MAG: ATP-binding protein [Cryomorphaceae bacterium]|nr:ATP-binding protein [Cryomorphaceae bacterium]
MLIQFSTKNYKIFRQRTTMSLVASEFVEYQTAPQNVSERNTHSLRILRSAVIYGANASGKSKFLEALITMRKLAIGSSKDGQKGDLIPVEPFLLHPNARSAPSEFEVVFYHNGCQYRYGFEADNKKVHAEWLYVKEKKREIEIFFREEQSFETHKKKFSRGSMIVKEDMVRDNALMLSVASQFNDPICRQVLDWFQCIEMIGDISQPEFRANAIEKIKSAAGKKVFVDYLKRADFGIQGLELMEMKDHNSVGQTSVLTLREGFDDEGKPTPQLFSLQDDESEGTKKYFYLLGPVLDVLDTGGLLIVDELDAKLHPNLVEKLVSTFHSTKKNPKNAQLIFNTHNTNLLHAGVFRRDQVWFAEKNRKGEGRLYSLSDFERNKSFDFQDFESSYIMGRFGAIPCLDDFDFGVEEEELHG